MMMLDVCSPVDDITKEEVNKQMQTTHKWATNAYEYFMTKYEKTK
jgi:queuine/archaeosine tRNA-ribosyltransferase